MGEKVPSYFYEGIPFLPAGFRRKTDFSASVWKKSCSSRNRKIPLIRIPFLFIRQEKESAFCPPRPIRELVNSYLDRDLPVMARASVQEGTAALEICFYHEPRKADSGFSVCAVWKASRFRRTSRYRANGKRSFFSGNRRNSNSLSWPGPGENSAICRPEAEALLEAGGPFAFLYQVTNADGKKYEATVAIERPRRLWQR